MEKLNLQAVISVNGGMLTDDLRESTNVIDCREQANNGYCTDSGGNPVCNNDVNGLTMDCGDTGGGGGGGGGKVICTELCRNGVIDHDVWMADIRYSRENFSEQTMRGYHSWGVPYVRLMRIYPAFARFAAKPTQWFAEDIAYRMGVRSKPNLAGWALRELAFRPMCWTLGLVVKARDWQALWRTDALPAKSA